MRDIKFSENHINDGCQYHLHLEAAKLHKPGEPYKKYKDITEFISKYSENVKSYKSMGELSSFFASYCISEIISMNTTNHVVFIDIKDLVNHLNITTKIFAEELRNFKALGDFCGFNVRFIPCILRQDSIDDAKKVLEFVLGEGFDGIGLAGGPELTNPISKFNSVLKEAAKEGKELILHTGEEIGSAPQIWEAIELGVKRIGHGVQAFISKDDKLIQTIKNQDIILDLCPISNECLGNVEKFPSKAVIESGVKYTINSDDPYLFNASLIDNFELFQKRLEE